MGLWDRMAGSLWGRRRVARDLADELAFHLEERTRENLARGMSPAAAAADARARLGHAPSLLEAARDADVIAWLDGTIRDLGHALRALARRPGLVAAAILSLTLGIGATSAIFSVVSAVLLRPLPLPAHDAVVALRETRAGEAIGGNAARFHDWQAQLTTVQDLAGFYGEAAVATGTGEPERLSLLRTFGPAMELAGATPVLGRGFTAEEARGDGAPVALLSHGLWQRRYGGDSAIVGGPVALNGSSYTIVGVLPASFRYPEGVDLVAPAPRVYQDATRGGGNYFSMIGRLAPGATLAAANAEATGLAARFAAAYPATDRQLDARVVPLQQLVTAEARTPLLVLLGAVFIVLLMACVNVASLLLARATERRHEAAIRVALGAGRASLARLYLLEGAWLALAGGASGLLAAWLAIPVLRRILPAELPRLAETALDWRVALFAAGLSMGAAIVFGLAPAWQATRGDRSYEALRDGGRTTVGSRHRGRRALVVVQVALSMLLLVAAGLLARSLYELRSAALGVAPARVLVLEVDFPWDTDEGRLHEFYRQVLEDGARLPGVRAVGLADRLPLEGGSQSRPVRLELPEAAPVQLPEAQSIAYRAVSQDYFTTIGVSLLAGRMWRDADADRLAEVVVNQGFARRYLPPGRPLGARLTFDVHPKDGAAPRWYEVVGVVPDVRTGLGPDGEPPEVFLSYRATYWPLAAVTFLTQGDPAALAAPVRALARRLEPGQVIDRLEPLTARLAAAGTASRVRTWLVGGFALAAVLLAAIGLYGVLASDVAQRRHEIGLRMALGAEPRQVLVRTVRAGLGVTAVGLALGGVAALAAGRVLAAALAGVRAVDPASFMAAAGLLLLVAVGASWLPARRAARVDPMVALRSE